MKKPSVTFKDSHRWFKSQPVKQGLAEIRTIYKQAVCTQVDPLILWPYQGGHCGRFWYFRPTSTNIVTNDGSIDSDISSAYGKLCLEISEGQQVLCV